MLDKRNGVGFGPVSFCPLPNRAESQMTIQPSKRPAMREARVAGVELGGTKIIGVIGQGRTICAREQWPTGEDPSAVLPIVADWLKRQQSDLSIEALGIASFGPICLDQTDPRYGQILSTPKPGWSGIDVIGQLSRDLHVPVAFDTDVAGAALAEGRWGAAVGCAVYVYLTIGTGIGGGIVIDGKPLHGALHPEIGHIRVRRADRDNFAGLCPFHGDCLEGLASGPAIAARAGRSAQDLPPDHPLWNSIASDIAEAMQMLILTISPQRIIIGGGVGQGQRHLLSLIRAETAAGLAGYIPDRIARDLNDVIVSPLLGGEVGALGSIALASSIEAM